MKCGMYARVCVCVFVCRFSANKLLFAFICVTPPLLLCHQPPHRCPWNSVDGKLKSENPILFSKPGKFPNGFHENCHTQRLFKTKVYIIDR